MEFYDWERTFSYDADLTVVTGARGIGKTYGLRKQFIRDYLKDGSSFVEVVRYAEQLKGDSRIQNGYFDRLEQDPEFAGLLFKTSGVRAYIAQESDKPEWKPFGYFVALTQAGKLKQRTFNRVRRVLMDEGILDPTLSQYQRYLTGEFELLMNVVSTVSRERPDTPSIRPRVYILGNAVDLLNPYFVAMGIGDNPKRGYSWHRGKTMLLHYPDPEDYAEAVRTGTVVGRLLAGSDSTLSTDFDNEFLKHDAAFFGVKPKGAKFALGVFHRNRKYGVWLDSAEGYYYVTNGFPNNAEPVYALTADDARPNYIMARRMQRALRGFVDLYYMGVVKYESESVRSGFLDVLALFGVR